MDFGLRSCPTITVAPNGLMNAVQYAVYSQTITAMGGVAPYQWSITGGALPAGLTLNASTGVVSGSPSALAAPASYSLTVQARDAKGCVGTKSYTLVLQCPGIAMTPTTLSAATQLSAYSATFSVSGGTAPYTFALAGTLPDGITFDPVAHTLTGTPTQCRRTRDLPADADGDGCLGLCGHEGLLASAAVPSDHDDAYGLRVRHTGPSLQSSDGGHGWQRALHLDGHRHLAIGVGAQHAQWHQR